ncbi:MAG: hypothetical protein EXS63_07980 [Candidatus Omnitrophica bacterium]|nr:hypothetical protein [Candidatus Omnitrophota bacterium]
MKLEPDKRIFWFLKEGVTLDSEKPEDADLYVQQILTHGSASDVKRLSVTLSPDAFRASFQRIHPFLPREVRHFWEHYLDGH